MLVAAVFWVEPLAGILPASENSTGTHDWISAALEVQGLPAGAQGVPVATVVNFSQILQDANFPETADTESLRLFQLSSRGDSEVPVQFSPSPQPRLKGQPLLPGTSPAASYLGEYRPQGTPRELQVTGTLSWLAANPSEGVRRYRLDFGVLRSGRPGSFGPVGPGVSSGLGAAGLRFG